MKPNGLWFDTISQNKRCTYNVVSYQDNLPPLWELRDSYLQKHYNIFLFIAVLVMIDEMIMKAYSEYERLEMLVM